MKVANVMPAYYNEFDPYAAQWIRNLITAGHIADGIVDQRSIEDIHPIELREFTQCHFFAGIGVWSRALRVAGWADTRPVWTGSCPCQPFSSAGKSAGFDDERHLWPAFYHLIEECRPAIVFGEQVASKDGLAWLDLVRADLEASRYTTGAADLCAAGVGAPHVRQRLYWVAHSDNPRSQGHGRHESLDAAQGRQDAARPGAPHSELGHWSDAQWLDFTDGKTRPVESGAFPLAHGVAGRVGRLRAYGNAIVPQVAAEFISAFDACRP